LVRLLSFDRRSEQDEEVVMRVVFVHGACVKDGSWWWHRTAELLAERDVASEAPALPSCGETGEPTGAQGPGLVEDVAAVREVLTASDEPTVVVAHSYGGIVTAEAAAGVDAVRHLLLVSSYLPEVRASPRSAVRSPPRFSTSIPRAERSPSGRRPWLRRSCRTAIRRSSDRPWTRRPGRA
jgi:pimeloyl-ACP methyl ester carboxylesterase